MKFTQTQIYVVLALCNKPKNSFLMTENIAAGAILTSLFESLDEKNIINMNSAAGKKLHKRFEAYAYQVGQKDTKNLMNRVVNSLAENACLDIRVQNGFLGRRKVSYRLDDKVVTDTVKQCKEKILDDSNESVIVLAAVLYANKLDHLLYDGSDKREIRERISSFKRTEPWKFAVNCVREIENQHFNRQLSSYLENN